MVEDDGLGRSWGLDGRGDMLMLVHEGVWISVSGVVSLFGGFMFWLVAGFLSGAVDIGYATTAYGVAALSAAVFGMGVPQASLRDVTAHGVDAYSSLFLISLALGAGAALFTLFFVNVYEAFTVYVLLAMFMAFVTPLMAVSVNGLIALQRSREYFAVNISALASRLSSVVIFLLMGLGGFGITLSMFASLLVGAVLSASLMVRYVGLKKPSKDGVVNVMKLGLSNYPYSLTALFVSGGIVMLGVLTGEPAEVGSFYIAVMGFLAAGTLSAGISTSLIPALTRKDDQGLEREGLRLALALTIPLAIPLAAYPDKLLALLGPSFIQASTPLLILSWGALPLTTLQIAYARLNSRRELKKLVIAGGLQLAALFVLVTVLSSWLGGVGAAIAYIASIATALAVAVERHELTALLKSLSIMAMLYIASIALSLTSNSWMANVMVIEGLAIAILMFTGELKKSDLKLIIATFKQH